MFTPHPILVQDGEMKKGVSLKQLLVICMVAVVSVYGIYSIITNWGLLSKAQSLGIARKWLNVPNWKPNEITKETSKCECGEQVHTYTLNHSLVDNDMAIVRIDRKSGNVVFWSSDFTGDNSKNPNVMAKAFKAWAPSHLPTAFYSKLSKMTPSTWVYRQDDGIWIPSTGVHFKVSKQGKVNYANISDCHLSDYNGSVFVNSAQAMRIARQWIANQYSGRTYEAWWLYHAPMVFYGFSDPVSPYTPIIYYEVACSFTDTQFCDSVIITVNASTGEVSDADSGRWDYLPLKAWPPKMLTVKYGPKQVIGYPKSLIPIKRLQALAAGHKLSAKADEKAFTLDGKRVALPAKVMAKAGTIYLPWQALKSLPGVKCSYNTKLNRLDITTAKAVGKIKSGR